MQPFEIWEDPETSVRLIFSYSDTKLTTGIMIIPPKKALPKHNRPLAIENIVQVSGRCLIKVFSEADKATEHILTPGTSLSMRKGQYHIHSNPYDEPSYTLFKADGDITALVQILRETFTRIELRQV